MNSTAFLGGLAAFPLKENNASTSSLGFAVIFETIDG